MFIGHAALALAAKPLVPRVSLALLLAATYWLDMVWPVFLLVGIEQVRIDPGNTAVTPLDFVHYPWSHSLAAALAWSALFGLACLRAGKRAALLLALLVFSHWVLDVITHRADMPLWPGSGTLLGFGLWNSIPATIAIECAMFAHRRLDLCAQCAVARSDRDVRVLGARRLSRHPLLCEHLRPAAAERHDHRDRRDRGCRAIYGMGVVGGSASRIVFSAR